MARPVVGNPFDNQIPTVSPTAAPVETYVRPAVKKSPFEALANTLSNLERKATPALNREFERQANKEYAEGQELYNKTRKAIGEAVKDGIIEEGASPYLRKGYRVANLNVLSARYAEELNYALTSRKLYTNGSPAAIEKFTEKFYEDFQKKHQFDSFGATEVAEYFSTSAAKANEAFRSSWRTKHLAYQKEQQYLAFQNQVSAYAEALFLETDSPEAREVKIANLGNWASNKAREAGIDGMNMAKVNQTITDSIIMSAYEMQDPAILDVLDNVQTGTGTLGGTLATRKAVFDAKGNIAQIIAQQDKAAAAELKRQQDEAVAQGMQYGLRDAFAARAGDPKAIENFSNTIRALEAVGTQEAITKAIALTNFYDAMTNTGLDERNVDTAKYAVVMNNIHAASEEEDVLELLTEALNDGEINESQSNTLWNQWDRKNGRNSSEGNLDFVDRSTGVPVVLSDFLSTVANTEADKIFGSAAELQRLARIEFENSYLLEYDEAVKAKGSPLLPREKREIANRVVNSIRDTYVSPTVDNKSTESLETIADERAREAARAVADAAAKGVVSAGTEEDILNVITGTNN